MTLAYNVVDADGHILEPLDLWDRYIDPEFRKRRPRFVIDDNGKERLSVEGKLWAIRAASAASAPSACGRAPSFPTPSNMPKKKRRVRSARAHRRYGRRRHRRSLLYPSLGLFAGAVEDPGWRVRCPRLQPLARRLLQAVPGTPVRGCDAADAVGRSRDRGNALRAPDARDARWLPEAEPVSRQENDQRPHVRAVLDNGRGTRFFRRLSRGSTNAMPRSALIASRATARRAI